MTITGDDIKALGLKPGPSFGKALAWAREELAKGQSWEETSRVLAEKFKEPEKLRLRPPSDVPEIGLACSPEGAEELTNVSMSLEKMRELGRVPVVESLALMPDNCPAGAGWGTIPVGGAIKTQNEIIPAAHSSDAFCSLHATFFLSNAATRALFADLQESTSFGPFPTPEAKRKNHPVLEEPVWDNPFLKDLEPIARNYLGSQGDGNHFASLGSIKITGSLLKTLESVGAYELAAKLHPHRDTELLTMVTHHGSRNLGARVFKRGLQAAVSETASIATGIPENGAWLDIRTALGKKYWEALEYVGRWTKANHAVIHNEFLKRARGGFVAEIGNEHNAVFLREDGLYHGKGATPAWQAAGKPRLGIIPLNMGAEILLVAGSHNPSFLSFAPHGAGRNRSRAATLSAFLDPNTKQLDRARVEASIKTQTQGILVKWASGKADISESPLGYKNAAKIREEIESFNLAKVVGGISPKACIMAGEIEQLWRKKRRCKTNR